MTSLYFFLRLYTDLVSILAQPLFYRITVQEVVKGDLGSTSPVTTITRMYLLGFTKKGARAVFNRPDRV